MLNVEILMSSCDNIYTLCILFYIYLHTIKTLTHESVLSGHTCQGFFLLSAVCKQANSRVTADATMYSYPNKRQMFDIIL